MGAGGGAAMRAGDVPAARREDSGAAEVVVAKQVEGREDALRQIRVGHGTAERAESFGIGARGGLRGLNPLGRPACTVGQLLNCRSCLGKRRGLRRLP